MGKVRFVQQVDYTEPLTCYLYRPNYTYYLVDENDKVLFTLEETTSFWPKVLCSGGTASYSATLYSGHK